MSYQPQPQPAYPQPQAGYNQYAPANTSGQGSQAIVPPEIQGWSWGGFWLSWIWGLGNNVMIALLALIVPFFNIYLGIKGNELAWQNKQWESVEHFRQVQRKWAVWGLGIAIAFFALGLVCFGIYFVAILAAVGSSSSY